MQKQTAKTNNTTNNNKQRKKKKKKGDECSTTDMSCASTMYTHSRQRVRSPQNLRPDQTLSNNLLFIHDT